MITLGQTEIGYSLAVIKLFFAIFAFLAVNYPLHVATAAPATIRVGYPQLNGGQTPLWNIPDGKIDQKYNLDIKPIYIPTNKLGE